jgi:hypothetical protein
MKDGTDRPTDIDRAAFKRLVSRMDAEDLADLLMKTVPAEDLDCVVVMLSGFFDSRMQMLKEGRTPPSYGLRLAD